MARNRNRPEPFGQPLLAFCDGSCPRPNGPGGWGYVILVGGRQYVGCGGEPSTTNQLMELEAAYQTLRAFDQMGFAYDQPFIVCSDSMYVVNGMGEWRKKWERNNYAKVKNVDLWRDLHRMADKIHHLTFAWVRGHAGHFFNEMADKLADKGRPR